MKKILFSIVLLSVAIFAENHYIDKVKESTLRILTIYGTDSKGEIVAGTGTGFSISSDGYFMTNAHVVCNFENGMKNAKALFILSENGEKTEASIVWKNIGKDLAVIKSELKKSPLQFSYIVHAGEKVIALGFPGAADVKTKGLKDKYFTVISENEGGIARIVNRPLVPRYGNAQAIQTDAAINHGNSGGPLLNQCAQIVGINESGVDARVAQGINFAVHRDEAIKLLEKHDIPYTVADSSCVYVDDAVSKTVNSNNTKMIILIVLAFVVALLIFWILLKKKTPTDSVLSRMVNKKIQEKEASSPKSNTIALRPLKQGQPITVGTDTITIGRSSSVQVHLSSLEVSGKHLTLELRDGVVYVTDLKSTNGTYIDGKKLAPYTAEPLRIGQRLIIGSEDVIYMVHSDG